MSTTFRAPAPDEQALLASLQVRLLEPAELARCSQLLDQYHYLKSPKPVGERLYYVVTDRQGQWKAACALPSIAPLAYPPLAVARRLTELVASLAPGRRDQRRSCRLGYPGKPRRVEPMVSGVQACCLRYA